MIDASDSMHVYSGPGQANSMAKSAPKLPNQEVTKQTSKQNAFRTETIDKQSPYS